MRLIPVLLYQGKQVSSFCYLFNDWWSTCHSNIMNTKLIMSLSPTPEEFFHKTLLVRFPFFVCTQNIVTQIKLNLVFMSSQRDKKPLHIDRVFEYSEAFIGYSSYKGFVISNQGFTVKHWLLFNIKWLVCQQLSHCGKSSKIQ